MSQLKKLKPDELKEEFDKCVEKVEKFIPINSELEASKLKRTGINLQANVFKKQKVTDVPDVTKDESVKREEEFKVQQLILRYNIRKSLAMKGLQKNKSESARSDTEEDVEAYMDERVDEPSSEEFQMGLIPQGSAPAKIVKWQILKTCAVHCLTLEAAHIYMLTEVQYPLPSRVCQAMLEKKLIGDRKDELANKMYGYQLTISVFVKSWLVPQDMSVVKAWKNHLQGFEQFTKNWMVLNLPMIHVQKVKLVTSPPG
ncbi:hypothetical protein Tco_0186191 [Tanacetum coccineum]